MSVDSNFETKTFKSISQFVAYGYILPSLIIKYSAL